MRVSTVINIEQTLKNRVRDIFREANISFYHYKKINDRYVNEVLNTELYQKIPRYSKSYINGYHAALFDIQWNKVQWVLPFNGELFKGFDALPKKGKTFYQGKTEGFFVYIKNPQKNYTGKKEQYQTGVE